MVMADFGVKDAPLPLCAKFERRKAPKLSNLEGAVPAEVTHFKDDPLGRILTLAKEPGRENVEGVSANLIAMSEDTLPADVLWLHLFYHDLHTALIQAKGATAADFNRAVYALLKPAGSSTTPPPQGGYRRHPGAASD
jgi:predicted methyltransferase